MPQVRGSTVSCGSGLQEAAGDHELERSIFVAHRLPLTGDLQATVVVVHTARRTPKARQRPGQLKHFPKLVVVIDYNHLRSEPQQTVHDSPLVFDRSTWQLPHPFSKKHGHAVSCVRLPNPDGLAMANTHFTYYTAILNNCNYMRAGASTPRIARPAASVSA